MLAGFLADLVLPLPTFGGTEIDEFAADGDKYGEEGVLRNSFRLEEPSSSGTLLRLRLESITMKKVGRRKVVQNRWASAGSHKNVTPNLSAKFNFM